MPINKSLKIENVVVLATNFNPSIISSIWLVNKEICKGEEILPNSFNTPQFSQILCNDFHILVLPDQIQFSKPVGYEGDFSDIVVTKLSKILSELPEVPYKSAGINFHWFLNDSKDEMNKFSHKLFYNKESKIYGEFNSPDAHFGAYLSKDYSGSRLKLDIKPISYNENNQLPVSAIQFAFNFHVDFTGDKVNKQVLEFLKNYNNYSKESKRIIDLYA